MTTATNEELLRNLEAFRKLIRYTHSLEERFCAISSREVHEAETALYKLDLLYETTRHLTQSAIPSTVPEVRAKFLKQLSRFRNALHVAVQDDVREGISDSKLAKSWDKAIKEEEDLIKLFDSAVAAYTATPKPHQAHSKSEYKRLSALGADVELAEQKAQEQEK